MSASRPRARLETVALVSMILATGVLVFVALENRATRNTQGQDRKPPALPAEPVSLVGTATNGQESARVALIVFSDFQCPFCARFAKETLPEIDRVFLKTGKVLLAFKHLPLESIHPFARPAAESAWCAGQQGRFWELHDRFFQNGSRLDGASIKAHVAGIGLDLVDYDRCVSGGSAETQVTAEASMAKRLGVSGTPAFLLGLKLPDGSVKATKWLTGSLPFAEFQREIDRILNGGRP